MTEHTKTGARGLILPASTELGNPAEETLLPDTVAELERLGIKIREVALDGGFKPGPTNTALADLQPKTVFIAGRQEPGSKRTQRRLRLRRRGGPNHHKRRYGWRPLRAGRDAGLHTRRVRACLPTAPSTRANPLPRTAARDHSAAVSYLKSFSAASRLGSSYRPGSGWNADGTAVIRA